MRALAETVYFAICLGVGRVLRAGRYSDVRLAEGTGEIRVLKRRRVYAPLLVRLSHPILRLLDTGIRVLPQREWQEHERRMYEALGRPPVRSDGKRLVLPLLPGATLASILDDPGTSDAERRTAFELAGRALVELHAGGFTHGDAMAENVLVDLARGSASWFDFETEHDPRRPAAWRRADDVRALVATALVRTRDDAMDTTLSWLSSAYPDEAAWRLLAHRFAPILQRPLAFHLGQAPLSLVTYRRIARLLADRFASTHPGEPLQRWGRLGA